MSRVQHHNCLIFSFVILHFLLYFLSCLAKMHNDFKSHVFYQFSVLSHEFKSRIFWSKPFWSAHTAWFLYRYMSEWRIINPFKLAPKYQAQVKLWHHKWNLQHFLWLFLAVSNHVRSSGAFLPGLMSRVCWIIDAPHLFSVFPPPLHLRDEPRPPATDLPNEACLNRAERQAASRRPLNFL